MNPSVGDALAGFESALNRLRRVLAQEPDLAQAVFEDTADWSDLLTYKLVPHLAGQGCLVAAVAGGTNTGKSTVFNLLLGRSLSPVVNTAAATCHPVLAANGRRRTESLENKLVPEFRPRPLDNATDATNHAVPADALYVVFEASLPDHLVVMDTPDVDSIDKQNWEVADHLRAAGDLLVAVVTPEKYKDDRVVGYFREALASGRMIVPVMNKANPAEGFAAARKQLDDFCNDVGAADAVRFVIAHDLALANDFTRPIAALDGGPDLRRYLETLDVPAIKERVYRGTIRHFAERASIFMKRAREIGAGMRRTVDSFENRAHSHALRYDPAPGPEVGNLFHEFVQSRRGVVRRSIGKTSAAFVKGTSTVGRAVTGAFRRRATLDTAPRTDAGQWQEMHRKVIEQIVREFAAQCIDMARNTPAPAGPIVLRAFETIDMHAAIAEVTRETLASENISEDFRQKAMATLETWWQDHRGKRRILEGLDIILAIMPAAIAAPFIATKGVGAAEAVAALGPLASQFVTRVMEYQFGDALFDFLTPWRREQQALLERALRERLTAPCLAKVRVLLEAFEGDPMIDLNRYLDQCLTRS